MALRTDITNTTPQADTHPGQHNEANALVNSLQALLAVARTDIDSILGELGTDPQGIYANVGTRIGVGEFQRAQRGIGLVDHGSNANTARPTDGFARYVWFGTVQPNNWADGDIYVDLSP